MDCVEAFNKINGQAEDVSLNECEWVIRLRSYIYSNNFKSSIRIPAPRTSGAAKKIQ